MLKMALSHHLYLRQMVEWARNKEILSRLAELISDKHSLLYSETSAWVKRKVNFSLLRTANICIRGSRSRKYHVPVEAVGDAIQSDKLFIIQFLTCTSFGIHKFYFSCHLHCHICSFGKNVHSESGYHCYTKQLPLLHTTILTLLHSHFYTVNCYTVIVTQIRGLSDHTGTHTSAKMITYQKFHTCKSFMVIR